MKKNLNKLATLALTGMMVAGMSFGAMAEGAASYTNAEYTDGKLIKKLSVDDKTFAPNATFSFEKKAVRDEEIETTFSGKKFGEEKKDLTNYLKGTTKEQVEGVTIGDAAFKADMNKDGKLDENDLATNGYFAEEVAIKIEKGLFTEPGMYVMGLKEKNTRYEGVDYDETQYYLLISVQNNEEGAGLKVASVQLFDGEGVKHANIVNGYGGEGKNDKVYSLNVEKIISGLGANKKQTFNFVVGVTAPEGSKDGGYAVYENDNYKTTIKEGETETLEVKNGTKYTIYGLSESDVVTIGEEEAGAGGYTTTYSVTSEAGIKDETESLTNRVMVDENSTVKVKKTTNEDGTVTIENNKGGIAVTGVAMDIAPYAVMVLGAGAFAGIFLGGKRRKAEDED